MAQGTLVVFDEANDKLSVPPLGKLVKFVASKIGAEPIVTSWSTKASNAVVLAEIAVSS